MNMNMNMNGKHAEVNRVNLTDSEPRNEWRKYRDSGMESLIAGYHLIHCLHALEKSGIAAALRSRAECETAELLRNVDRHLGENLLRYLAIRGLVRESGPGMHRLTDRGRELLGETAMAQLGFYLESYGPVTSRMDQLLCGQEVYGKNVQRNGEALGRHCATLFHAYHTPTVLTAMRNMDAHCILDLGCGAGAFLIDAAKKNPELRGVGLDISEGAIAVANEVCRREGLADRLKFVVGDAFRPDTWPVECREVDALCAVGVIHEHFRDGEQAVVDILNTYAVLFESGLKGFILGEPEIHYDDKDNDSDLYLIHIFTAQGFPRHRDLWLDLFPKTKLQCRAVYGREDAGPRFNFFDLVLKS